MLAVTYLLMWRALRHAPTRVVVELPPGVESQIDKGQVVAQVEAAERASAQYRALMLRWLLEFGGVALVLVSVVAVALGWWLAGRVLRPLGAITATARRVAEHSLHERIRAGGPRDEVRELADTFDSMLDRLDRAFDGQRAFVGNASHELRTPLAINRTLVEVALSRPDAPAQLVSLGENLLAVNERQERMIEGLLLLARSQQRLSGYEPVDLAQLCARLAPDAEADLAAVTVRGDPVLLERLVHNLVENARRYNAPDGWLRVATAASPDGAVLTVENPGPVIAGHEVDRLFEPFRRLGADRVGSARGSGLGLSIVRSVAQAHGGEVTAQPRPASAGGGLLVTVRFPTTDR
jgi:signal transduction histidine kinase